MICRQLSVRPRGRSVQTRHEKDAQLPFPRSVLERLGRLGRRRASQSTCEFAWLTYVKNRQQEEKNQVGFCRCPRIRRLKKKPQPTSPGLRRFYWLFGFRSVFLRNPREFAEVVIWLCRGWISYRINYSPAEGSRRSGPSLCWQFSLCTIRGADPENLACERADSYLAFQAPL